MSESSNPPRVFLSYVHSDVQYGSRMRELLENAGVEVREPGSALQAGESFRSQLWELIAGANTTMVLIGPDTRRSRSVDFEIDTAVSGGKGRPGTALIAVVLPNHPDFESPYYDPALVPLRMHDLLVQEFALLRKWTESTSEILNWLAEAQHRRQRLRCPSISFKTSFALREFKWDPAVDKAPVQAN